jgi:hypothetical protein
LHDSGLHDLALEDRSDVYEASDEVVNRAINRLNSVLIWQDAHLVYEHSKERSEEVQDGAKVHWAVHRRIGKLRELVKIVDAAGGLTIGNGSSTATVIIEIKSVKICKRGILTMMAKKKLADGGGLGCQSTVV